MELFTAYPDTQLLFRAFHAEDLGALESSNAALQHGQTVCALVQRVVQSLDDYDAVWDILLKSGRSHFSESVPLNPSYPRDPMQ